MSTTFAAIRPLTFHSGIHPREEKYLAEHAAIEVLPTPPEVRIPLLQHLGAPCVMTVKPKAVVSIGDVVGQAEGFVSAPVHASIDGTVARPSVTTLPNGRHVDVVPIKAADQQSFEGMALYEDVLGGDWPTEGFERLDPDEIADAARDGGLVGLGGAAFPSHVKLRRNDQKPIDSLIVNGCECEPYLTADDRVMLEAPGAVITGALLAQRAIGAEQLVVGVEDNKPDAIEALLGAAAGTGMMIRVLKTKYPQGGEKQLIDAILQRRVPTGGLPLDVGVVVLNVGTCAALARAVLRGKPLTHRVITVSGAGVRNPKNLLVPIGASYQSLIDYCGGLTPDVARVIAGGPMMGFTISDLKVPVTKGSSGVVVLTHGDVRKSDETACVRCGRCIDVCPLNLVPTRIALAARAGLPDIAERYYASACMECGCCAYECPASIPLVQLIRLSKVMLQNKKNKA
ncbi:MAG: electron transport complex subunit RsxC [Pirellulales bacterium]|nr:electron transport complex subunit RsxC [Pirellulales bacterium]